MGEPSENRLITVKDIAECIAFDKSEVGIIRTIRQVRHWTQNDLLRPISQKETGKGVPRVYAVEPTIEIAAILLELTRYGVTVDILKPVADGLWDTDEAILYLGSALTHINSYLQVAWKADPETGQFSDAEFSMFDDLDFQASNTEDPSPINDSPSSSILINMSEEMGRLFPLPWQG